MNLILIGLKHLRVLWRQILPIEGVCLTVGLCAFLLQNVDVYSQGLTKEWAREFSLDPTKANTPVAAMIAPDGNLVVAGTSEDAAGDKDYQVIKYRSNGDLIWRATFASPTAGTPDIARGLSIDSSGNIFVTGTTSTVKFNSAGQKKWSVTTPGWTVVANSQYVYVTGISDVDIVTAQLQNNDFNGQENWRRTLDPFGFVDIGQAITLDNAGNVYVGGMVGTECGAGICRDTFGVVSYSPTGVQRLFGNTPPAAIVSYVQVFSILVLDDGSPAIFGNDEGPVFAKFSSTGALEWEHTYFTLAANEGSKMIRDRITGNFVIAGKRHKSGTDTDEAFVGIIKQDRTYQRIWSYASDIGFTKATDVVQDSKGNFFVVGWSTDDAISTSMFIAKVTPSGQQMGLDRYVSPGKVSTIPVAVAVDAVNNAYVVGYNVNAQGASEWETIKYPTAPKIEKKQNGAMHLEFYTAPEQQFSIEASTNFVNWQSLITNNADINGIVQFDDTAAPSIPYRFYRGNSAP